MPSELDAVPPSSSSVGRFLLRGGIWVSMGQLLGTGCAIASQMLLARLLAPEALGAYFLIQSVVIPAAQVSQLGMVRPLTRLVAQAVAAGHPEQIPGIVRAALLLALAAAFVVVIVYLGIGDWLADSLFDAPVMAQGTLLAAAWTLALTFQQISSAALRGLHRVAAAAFVAESGAKILTAAGLALIALAGGFGGAHDFPSILAVPVGGAGIMGLLGIALLLPSALFGPAQRGSPAVLLRASLPLVATGVIQVALNVADVWVVGARFTPDQVALYGAAKRLILVISLPLMLLPLVVPPVIADLHMRGELQRLQRVIRGATTLTGLPAVLVLLFFIAASEPLLGLAFGDFYRGAATVLVLLSIERIVFVWVGPCSLTLLMTGHETAVMKITVSMGLVTVGLVYAGVLAFGFVGAAIGFVVGSAVHQLLAWYAVQRLVGIRTHMALRDLPEAIAAVRRALDR